MVEIEGKRENITIERSEDIFYCSSYSSFDINHYPAKSE